MSGPGRRVRLRGKTGEVAPAPKRPTRQLVLRRVAAFLPHLHRHTEGRPFGPQLWRVYLRRFLDGTGLKVPSEEEGTKLLRNLARGPPCAGTEAAAAAPEGGAAGGAVPSAWRPQGTRYINPEASCDVSNIVGFARSPGSGAQISWNEYGTLYRVCRAAASSKGRGEFQIVPTSAFKRLGCAVVRKSLQVDVDGRKSEFKGSVVFEPCRRGLKVEPAWTLIYLHSFSCKGTDYLHFPHYFGIGGAAVRVVVPTAPMLEQSCFKDWNVWRGERLGWRRIKFRAWFDYLTDKGGSGENKLNLGSLLEMRGRLHALIRQEARRYGGDSRRVLIGGASQGCCVALDAAMTYPEELGGVVGLVGHILSDTPLNPAKRAMPLHLFHEATDKEMKWSWVKDTVQRLVDEGFNVTSKRETDPTGSGHWIQEIEGKWICEALRQITMADAG